MGSFDGHGMTDWGVRRWKVTLTAHNTGAMDGAVPVQLYFRKPFASPVRLASIQLVRFEKVWIPAGSSVVVEIELVAADLGYWDDGTIATSKLRHYFPPFLAHSQRGTPCPPPMHSPRVVHFELLVATRWSRAGWCMASTHPMHAWYSPMHAWYHPLTPCMLGTTHPMHAWYHHGPDARLVTWA